MQGAADLKHGHVFLVQHTEFRGRLVVARRTSGRKDAREQGRGGWGFQTPSSIDLGPASARWCIPSAELINHWQAHDAVVVMVVW